jgi:hypothetical protein
VKTRIRKALLLLLVLAPLFLVLMPADYFDGGDTLCLYKNLIDFKCPGCGLTRGLMHLIHLDFESAWSFSPLAFVAAPVLAVVWLHLLGKLINKPVFRFLEKLY